MLGLIGVCVVLIAIPGPSMMFLVGQALCAGRDSALRGVFGNAAGIYLIAVIVAISVGDISAHASQFICIVRFFGACVLAGIGCSYLRPASIKEQSVSVPSRRDDEQKRSSFLSGFIIGVTNPKALILFAVIVPSFIPRTGNQTEALLTYSLVPVVLGIAIDVIWVCTAHAIKVKSTFLGNKLQTFRTIGGVLMIMMALALVLELVRYCP